MPLLQVLIVLVVVGFLLWLVNRLIPMQRTMKSILNVVVIICVAIWLLNISGMLHSISRMRLGH
ncbi:MAG TPA: Thivi_2564 family membrane protein [Candidatus Angelobacter sp.]